MVFIIMQMMIEFSMEFLCCACVTILICRLEKMIDFWIIDMASEIVYWILSYMWKSKTAALTVEIFLTLRAKFTLFFWRFKIYSPREYWAKFIQILSTQLAAPQYPLDFIQH